MAHHELPARPSLEYLKKLAKDRLRALRETDPGAKLANAQLAVAREHGFSSWRALKKEVGRRAGSSRDALFAACAAGDLTVLRQLLDREPELATRATRTAPPRCMRPSRTRTRSASSSIGGRTPMPAMRATTLCRCTSPRAARRSRRCRRFSTPDRTCTARATRTRWT
jgi:hypothetical protein